MKKLSKKVSSNKTIQSYRLSSSCSCSNCPPIPTHAVGERSVSNYR